MIVLLGADRGTFEGFIQVYYTWINVDNRCPYVVEKLVTTWKVFSTDNVSAASLKTGWYFRIGSSCELIPLNHTSLKIPADSREFSENNNNQKCF